MFRYFPSNYGRDLSLDLANWQHVQWVRGAAGGPLAGH